MDNRYLLLSNALNATRLYFLIALFGFLTIPTEQAIASHHKQKTLAVLSNYLDTHDSITPEMKEKSIERVIEFRDNFKVVPNNEYRTLKRLFDAVQYNFLRKYELYASFWETTVEGKYDCLTASVLYTVFLDHLQQRDDLDFEYDLCHTPTHVYIKVRLSNGRRLILESTNANYGFISSSHKVSDFLSEMQKSIEKSPDSLLTYSFINNSVTQKVATALLYFNQGIKFFNQRKFGKSQFMAHNATEYQRNIIFFELILLSKSSLNASNKF